MNDSREDAKTRRGEEGSAKFHFVSFFAFFASSREPSFTRNFA